MSDPTPPTPAPVSANGAPCPSVPETVPPPSKSLPLAPNPVLASGNTPSPQSGKVTCPGQADYWAQRNLLRRDPELTPTTTPTPGTTTPAASPHGADSTTTGGAGGLLGILEPDGPVSRRQRTRNIRLLEKALRLFDATDEVYTETPAYLLSVLKDPSEHTRARLTAAKGLVTVAQHNLSVARVAQEAERGSGGPVQVNLNVGIGVQVASGPTAEAQAMLARIKAAQAAANPPAIPDDRTAG